MDERRQWFTSKILQTFQTNLNGILSVTIVEEFMRDGSTIQTLNEFFQQGGNHILFFYMSKSDSTHEKNRDVELKLSTLTSSELSQLSVTDNVVGVYFVKRNKKEEITINNIEQELLSGEVKQSIICAYRDLVKNALYPMISYKCDWGKMSEDDVLNYITEFSRQSEMLVEFCHGAAIPDHFLKIPKENSLLEFRKAPVNPAVIKKYESLVTEWIQAIEPVLMDSVDESESSLYTLPKNMLSKWQRRLKTIQSVTDLLKLKQYKTIVALLITSKAKIMKKWRVIDTALTDVFNDVKDKVKFLESMKKFFEPNRQNLSLVYISNTFLPDLFSHLRHMDSVSRYYAKTGFLGTLFAKISYLVACLCHECLQSILTSKASHIDDALWEEMFNEIVNGELKHERVKLKKKIANQTVNTGLMNSLYAMLSIFTQYRDMLRSLRDSYGLLNQLHSVNIAHTLSKQLKQANAAMETPASQSTISIDKATDSGSSLQSGATSVIVGVVFRDEATLLYPVTTFLQRVHQMIDIIETMKQFHSLIGASRHLPLLVGKDAPKQQVNNNAVDSSDEESQDELSDKEEQSPEVSEEDKRFTVKSFSAELQCKFNVLSSYVRQELTFSTFYDIENLQANKFDEVYTYYVKAVKEFESMVEFYVRGLLNMTWSTLKILEILNSFRVVVSRTSLQSLFELKYNQAILHFESDLDTTKNIYEQQKDDPPKIRNVPAVSSAVFWSRSLYNRIEKNMKMISAVKVATESKRYSSIVKTYNKLATILLLFEENWISLWRSRTEQGVAKLLNLTLLAKNVSDKKLFVYANPRLIELFCDVRSLKRLGIHIPPSIIAVCQQESKFKYYKHMLEYFVQRYYDLSQQIPEHFVSIMKPVHATTLAYFQPGLSVLKWDSINIDGFLYKLEEAINKFEDVHNKINVIIREKIDFSIEKLKGLVLFDQRYVCSKTWTNVQFLTDVGKSTRDIGEALYYHIATIEKALKDIVNIMSDRNLVSLIPPSKCLSPVSFSDEKKSADQLFSYYASQVYSIVLKCISKSLQSFHQCCVAAEKKSDGHLKFSVSVQFVLPHVVLQPSLVGVQEAVSFVAQEMIELVSNVKWWDEHTEKTFMVAMRTSDNIIVVKEKIDNSILEIGNEVQSALLVFAQFNFLWLEDMNGLYKKFEDEKPDVELQHAEVKRLLAVEENISAICDEICVQEIVLDSTPIKDSLSGFCTAWKMCYVHKLHSLAGITLKEIVSQREGFFEHLNRDINTLNELNHVLNAAEHITDMNNQIDDHYLPVETLYKTLSVDYNIPLPREELQTVACLRERWKELMVLAGKVTKKLVQEQRSIFEQELDKQVKEFVVGVIQFRNSFDSQGPGIPGITPDEATLRLTNFQEQYDAFEEKMHILHAVQKLYGIMPTPFHELQKTGKEIELLRMLYEVYQEFLRFDHKFRETLWSDVNLSESFSQVNRLYNQCISLPTVIHAWFAYKKLKESIAAYKQIFPILHDLDSKEIRNRHWLQVMHVTKRSFQLEAKIFKLHHILNLELNEHKEAIEQILISSKAELELEIKFRAIEEEWVEQIVKFEPFKSRGSVVFDKDHMNQLLDSLEDSKTSLNGMLNSKHVTPLRDEAAVWSLKLNEVSEVLEEWLIVEELWINLESVFSYENTVKQLQEQSALFEKADRPYMKLMKKTAESAKVLQCCLAGEVSKVLILKQISKELGTCFQSIGTYLNGKRNVFPRLHFVCDEVLLSMLCKRHSVESVSPYISEVISGIYKLKTVKDPLASSKPVTPTPIEPQLQIERYAETYQKQTIRKKFSVSGAHPQAFSSYSIPSDFGTTQRASQRGSERDNVFMEFPSSHDAATPDTSVTCAIDLFGEELILGNPILLDGPVEDWLKQILSESKTAVKRELLDCIKSIENGAAIEDGVLKYPCQVILMAFFNFWTKESEKAIHNIRIDRKSFVNLNKRFSSMMSRLTQILTRGTYKPSLSLTQVQKMRLQCVIAFGLFAYGAVEKLSKNKLRDVNDYEWQQTMRCYAKPVDEEDTGVSLFLKVLDHTFDYRNEFLGCDLMLVMTMSSERVMLNLVLALANHKAGCVSGDLMVSRSVFIQCAAILFGEHCISVDCLSPLSLKSMRHIFLGVAADGSWCMFRDFQGLTHQHLKLLQYCLSTIQESLKNKARKLEIDMFAPVDIKSTCGVFLTTSLQYIHQQCPAALKMNLRNTSIDHPDMTIILRMELISHGFKASKALAYSIKLVTDIAKDQIKCKWNFGLAMLKLVIVRAAKKHQFVISNQRNGAEALIHKLTINKVMSVNTFAQSTLSPPGTRHTTERRQQWENRNRLKSAQSSSPAHSEALKVEFSLIANSLVEMANARLSDEESLLFKNIVQKVFANANITPLALEEDERLERVAKIVLKENSHESTRKLFVDKVIQLKQLSQVNHGIVVCGDSKSGKSTIISTLIEALRKIDAQSNKGCSMSYKHEHITVLAVSSLDQMFGYTNAANEWVDGVFTVAMKKANQRLVMHRLSTWITLDGPLCDEWCFHLESLFNYSKVFVQPDLRRRFLSNDVKILCETDSLTDSSPACVGHMGILYVGNSVLGWRPIADAWLSTQKSTYFHILQRAFNKTVDRVLKFIQEEAECCVPLSETAIFSSCLDMLSSLLQEHSDLLAGDLHIERLYLFSLIWMFGGLLVHEQERIQFNALLLTLSNAFPDDDREISVYDYYVDALGEWDTWTSRLSDYNLMESIDTFGGTFLETVHTYRVKLLINQYLENGNNVLLIGPMGVGKTCIIQDLLKNTANKNEVPMNLTFTHCTDATFLQKFVENNLYRRQGDELVDNIGFIYGAKNNKTMRLFVDDVHLPRADMCDKQSVNELLRQLIDQKVVFSHAKHKPKFIEGLHVVGAMDVSSFSSNRKTDIKRLLGKFGVLYLTTPNEKYIFSMTSSLLEANLTHDHGASLPVHLHNLIVQASVKLITHVSKQLFSLCTRPPRHYLFNIGDLASIFRMLQRCPEEIRADTNEHSYLLEFWLHEVKRTFADRMVNSSDMCLFNQLFDTHVNQLLKNVHVTESMFTTFTTDSHLHMHRPLSMQKLGRKVPSHQRLSSISAVEACVLSYVNAYCNDTAGKLGVVWHDFHTLQLIKFHRVLSQDNRGNVIVVHSAVDQMINITKLVAFMLNQQFMQMDCTSQSAFLKKLRVAVRTAGCENKHVTLCVKASNVQELECFDSLSSIMSLGEYTSLFSDTEMHGLLVALRPKMKRLLSNSMSDPKQFFTRCVRKNLHVAIFASSKTPFFANVQKMYPAIFCNSHVIFVADDSRECLSEECMVCLNRASFWTLYDEQTKENAMKTLEDIHLRLGSMNRNEHVFDELNGTQQVVGAVQKRILQLVQKNYHENTSVDEVNVLTFKRFLHCFHAIMQKKVSDLKRNTKLRSEALKCLSAAEERCAEMKIMKKDLQTEYDIIVKKVATLLDELFHKSSLIERLKAKLNLGNKNFQAFMGLIGSELMEDDEEFLWEEEHDELDDEYDRIQSASQERMKSLSERITEAEALLQNQTNEMESAKELLKAYQMNIDRACIEKLRAYQSPPILVGTIMVMLMILLGRPEFAHYVVKETRGGTGGGGSEKKSDAFFNGSENGAKNNSALDGGTRSVSPRSRTLNHVKTFVENTLELHRSHKTYIMRMTSDLKNCPRVEIHTGSDGRVDRATWKTLQQIMQDTQKFCEVINTYNWSDGAPNDVLNTVVQFFVPGEEIPVCARTALWGTRSQTAKERQQGLITLQAARFSSEDAAQVVEYVQLVIHFTRKYRLYRRTLKALSALRVEKEDEEQNTLDTSLHSDDEDQIEDKVEDTVDDLEESDLSRLQDELLQLEGDFDVCTIKKRKLKEQIQEFQNLCDSTTQVVRSFRALKSEWGEYCGRFSEDTHLLGNVMTSATFLSYCAAKDTAQRKKLMAEVSSLCEENGFASDDEPVLSHQYLVSFLFGEIEERQLVLNHLPTSTLCAEFACFLKRNECMDAWPLLCDPYHIGLLLVQRIFPRITVVSYENVENVLEEALVVGTHLLVTDVDVNGVLYSENTKFKRVLESYNVFQKSSVKFIIGQKEVDCSPEFSMILATNHRCEDLPFLPHVNKLYVPESRDMMTEIFLNFFVAREKSQLSDSITKTNMEIVQQMKWIEKLEDELLSLLSQEDCFRDVAAIQNVLSIKKQFDESSLCKKRAEGVFRTIKTSEESYTMIAKQAAVLFHVDAAMLNVNSVYQISIHRFLRYFAAAIKHSDRVTPSAIVERVLTTIFPALSKAKLEVDRPLFALMVAVETEDVRGRIAVGDREFFVSHRLGALIKQYHSECQTNQNSTTKSSIKKPFDWMSDCQYQHLLILSQHYDAINETFEKMARDGREMQWRQISEHDTPEMLPLPDNLDQRYTPLQRYLLIKTFRPDRTMAATEMFITTTLGKRFAVEVALDLKSISYQTPQSIPILLLYDKDAFLVLHLLTKSAAEREVRLITLSLNKGKNEEDFAKETLTRAMLQGCWLLLQEVHHQTELLSKLLFSVKKQKCDPAFRLWLSADMTACPQLAERFHACAPIVIDTPRINVHSSLVHNFHLVDGDIWKASLRNEWLPSLHNICMLHATLLQRCHLGNLQQVHAFQFDALKFVELISFMEKMISKEMDEKQNTALKNLPWPSIKQMVYKIVYGREITNNIDSHILVAIIDYWMSSAAATKYFEVPRVRYKLPAAFFSISPKVSNSLQAVENLSTSVLAAPEFCGLFATPEMATRSSLYDFDKFECLIHTLPECNSIVHPNVHVTFMKDMDLMLLFSNASKSAYIDTYLTMTKFRKLELSDVISAALSKLPKLWSRDFVAERVRKTGGLNTFNMWLLSEADSMAILYHTIKKTLYQARDFLEGTKEMQVTDDVVSVLLDLYDGLIPAEWIKRAGPSSPPASWTMMAWMSDFLNRCQHVEKILLSGRDKMAGYWLAAFFNPRRLISIFIQDSIPSHQSILSRGEHLIVKTEMTTRDKDHLRDPPVDGMYIHGLWLWGTSWEKATNEFHDAPPKAPYYSLPVLHVQLVPTSLHSTNYACPCYSSRSQTSHKILSIDIDQKDVSALKWSLRGLTCTLRPF